MPVFAKLISANIIHLIGLIVYGLVLIGLTALGYKVIGAVVGFRADQASEKQSLFMGIIILGLIIGLSLIIAITSYESSPEVVLASGANIVGEGGCGSARSSGGCGSKVKKLTGSPSGQPPVSQVTPLAGSPVTPAEAPPQ